MLDAVVVGGGFAGLSAALVLGRCRRAVVVADGGPARNRPSNALHGYLTRDGTPPAELLRIARDELRPYPEIRVERVVVADVARADGSFAISLADGGRLDARHVLLATGIVDVVPEVAGFDAFYGQSVFACPYCDGWEVRGQPLAAYARGATAAAFAHALTVWSRDVVLVSDGPAGIDDDERARLAAEGIPILEQRVAALEGSCGQLEQIRFAEGPPLARRALFFTLGQHQRSPLPARLGCRIGEDGGVEADGNGATSVPGVWVAGDASRDVQLAIVAAAEGARAAFGINKALVRDARP